MSAMIDSARVGVYCTLRLGDDPERSRTGCRYYVYISRTCESWLDYRDIDTAVAENPGQPVFDRANVKEILLEQIDRMTGTANGESPIQTEMRIRLLKMLRDLGVRDDRLLWQAAMPFFSAAQRQPEAA
jgi:hypothetical protein